jgi:predicted  nucleic acid-binding Zn-ribbon protein
MSDHAPTEQQAFRDLETLVHHLADELSTFRRRALQAEAKLKDIETAEGGASNIGLAQRVAELERENASLRKRLDAVSEKTKQMLDRVRFLRQQAQGSER